VKLNLVRHISEKRLAVAFSGGVDSVVLAEYLMSKQYDIVLAHFIHDSPIAEDELAFTLNYAKDRGLEVEIDIAPGHKNTKQSTEEHWRNARYEFFKKLEMPVAMGHHLDDAVEWYLFTALHGEGRIMEYAHANVFRPMLLTPKQKIIEIAEQNGFNWFDDPTNSDASFAARNRVRHRILPEALKINPGLYNVVKKKILAKLAINN
jgi:tRNA(Ile)-lysidine synthase